MDEIKIRLQRHQAVEVSKLITDFLDKTEDEDDDTSLLNLIFQTDLTIEYNRKPRPRTPDKYLRIWDSGKA